MKYLWTGKALEEFIFFECLYFSQYDTRMLLFVFFWLRNRPSIKYVRYGNGGEKSKMCTGAYRARGVKKSVIRYVLTKWMAPSKVCGIFVMKWFGQVH